jgi:hypothetical protein
LTGCSANGCTFTAPGPSLAMVFLDDAQYQVITTGIPTTNNSSNSSPSGSPGGAKSTGGALRLNRPSTTALGIVLSLVTLTFFSL